jgi:hypothetical protein
MTLDPLKGVGHLHKVNEGNAKGQPEKNVKATPPDSLGKAIKECTTDKASREIASNHTWSKGSNDLKGLNPNNIFFPLKK